MTVAEPTLQALRNPLARYFFATRPAFLSVTLAACLIGLASAYYDGPAIDPLVALLTVLFALVAHAGVNVLNDYYDALNGSDDHNSERLFPFTGGSRFIQNGVLTKAQTARFGWALVGGVVLAGAWLTRASGSGLLAIGVAGLFIGWGYSAPPLKLNSRGLGELCVATGFLLIVIGADYVQRHAFAALPVVAGASYALLVTNLLYINQFPDRAADLLAGKRHWVARLGPQAARWGYAALAAVAYVWVMVAVTFAWLPSLALAALLSLPLSIHAIFSLFNHAHEPRLLVPAIRSTIAAALVHGTLLGLTLALSG